MTRQALYCEKIRSYIHMPAIDQTASRSSLRSAGQFSSFVDRLLLFICSVRLGIVLLVTVCVACLVGMVVMQQNVTDFDRYFASLTPGQRSIYSALGLFNIYHSWYFNALLVALALNIVLASIDRFPKTWATYSSPNIVVPLHWLRQQQPVSEITIDHGGVAGDEVSEALQAAGWRKVLQREENGRLYFFAESGRSNRFGAYPVHVALLTIFFGGFLTAQLSQGGQMAVTPGVTSDLIRETVVEADRPREVTKRLPYQITGVDIQQKLIRDEGPISTANTIDWVTRFAITDETGTHEATVKMNRPFDYRGYRFFQSSSAPVGKARTITLDAIPANGPPQRITISRGGEAVLANGTRVSFADFHANFRSGIAGDPTAYIDPVAILSVIGSDGAVREAHAFHREIAAASELAVSGDHTFRLVDFEKVSDHHILSIQRDPGASVVYVGFVLLFLSLVGVFFFSHQRIWAVVDHSGRSVVIAGNTNRNHAAFHAKFRRLLAAIEGKV